MSLGIVVKGPEGLVLAAESRVTITVSPTVPSPQAHVLTVNFDHAVKLLSFSTPNSAVGAVTYGQAAIGMRTAYSFIPEFEAELPQARLSVKDFATHLSRFFAEQWRMAMPSNYQGPDMMFVVAGFDSGEPYGRVYKFGIPSSPNPMEQQPSLQDFGVTWGGTRDFVERLMHGFDGQLLAIVTAALKLQPEQVETLTQALQPLQMPIPLQAMALQDCVDLAIFFIRTTIAAQHLTLGPRDCGGPIDVATITRSDGLRFVQRKQLVGEAASLGCPS